MHGGVMTACQEMNPARPWGNMRIPGSWCPQKWRDLYQSDGAVCEDFMRGDMCLAQ